MPDLPLDDARLKAGVDLLGRMGAKTFRVGFSPEEDGDPTVWYATVTLRPELGGHSEAAAAMNPVRAVVRLAEQLGDGGTCTHCHKPTGVVDDTQASDMPMAAHVCWIAYDPELATFRRSCEGVAP